MIKAELGLVTCRRCGHPGSDLQILGCGCTLHARCTPLSLVAAERRHNDPSFGAIPAPAPSKALTCPFCQTGLVQGIRLFPISFLELETAMELRKRQVTAASTNRGAEKEPGKVSGHKHRRDSIGDDALSHQIQVETSYLLLSHTSTGHGHGDSHSNRTGRWTSEEMSFVDQLVSGFDQGVLAIPYGMKLNEFLGDMLLCKSSRLTKKMKNAKLSTRSYTIHNTPAARMGSNEFCSNLSAFQERFLQSVTNEATQMELRFNMSKLWRTHFSNLCLQIGYDGLDASDWLSSLEEMERRASDAEESIRKARRRRMGLALKKDVGNHANPGVFVGGMAARDASVVLSPSPSTVVSSNMSLSASSMLQNQRATKAAEAAMPKQENEEIDFLADFLEMSGVETGNSKRPRLFSEDMTFALDDLVDPLNMGSKIGEPSNSAGVCGPFLQQIVAFMKAAGVPFEHVDIWVPSYMPSSSSSSTNGKGDLRLFHAGHATRSNVDPVTSLQLNEYGNYSTNFSFAPGVGLPGRVYVTGQPSWENMIHEADPHHFERAGGAKVYGVRTGLGIPVDSPDVGRVVVALYSTKDVPEDAAVTKSCIEAFSQWSPEPKWKLVIDTGSDPAIKLNQESTALPVPKQLAGNAGPTAASKSRTTSVASVDEVQPPSSAPHAQTTTTTTPQGTLICHDHTDSSSPSLNSTAVQSSTPSDDDDLDNRIATLLGDNMPLTATSEPGVPAELLQHFMSLRLLLLRSASRRSAEEKDVLDILKKSFLGYSRDNRRTGAELASLLAKDWMYLTAGLNAAPTSSPVHQSHVMALPAGPTATSPVLTHALSQPPNPGLIPMAHPVSFSSLNSYDSSKGAPRSRSVSASSDALSPNQVPSATLLNVVPET